MNIPPTPQEIARNAFCSTVALEAELANGGRHTVGSGFFIGKDLIATNLHVIHGLLGNCYAKLVNQTNEYPIEGYTHIDVERDLVILKVSGVSTTMLPWGNSDDVQVGDTVYAVGNPRGLQGTFSDGIISGIRWDTNGKVLQMTAPISPGSSGGPVLNDRGNVIGISFMIYDGQNLNFAIPSIHLSALFAKPANLQPLYFTKFEGIKLGQPLNWEKEKTATYTFSLQNNHRWDVKNIDCLVSFYDQQGQHIGFDIVKYSDRIPAGSTRNISRSSIFDIPYVQDFDYSGWRFDQMISHLIPFIIRSGGDPSNYNIIDPIANQPHGSNIITIIDYTVLTES